MHKIARKLLSVGIHPLLGSPNIFKFSSNYNKIHPLTGVLFIINLFSPLSSLYYKLTKL